VKIAIDASSLPPRPAGAGVYALELVRALAERDDRHDGYAVFARGDWFDAVTAGRKNWRIERVAAGSRPARLAWEQTQLPAALERLGADVLHSTHHTLPVRPMHARRIVTMHDVTFFRLRDRYPPVRRLYMQTSTRLAARVADAIIVPSRAVRDDVTRTLGVPAEKVRVVYEAAAEQYRPVVRGPAEATARRAGIDPPYLLSVGSLEPGKNRGRIIRALRHLRDAGVDARLAVVGQKAWRYEQDFALARELGMEDRIEWLGYVPAEDMPALYSAATAFVFPSLYEGFGLPVLEAMACGTPVITSEVSATAEVAGDAALLVDPQSVPAIADALRRVLTDEALRCDLRERGLRRAAEFSWARAAEETHALYATVVDARR
jgi:glycosyltransferase involved in cell wall biosynthesis